MTNPNLSLTTVKSGKVKADGTFSTTLNPRTRSYEKYNGFGHEEWNFNAKFQLGEYKYGFLEPINKCFDKYAGKVYNISLFTHDGVEKVDYWVTTLKDVEIPCKEETEWVLKEYKKMVGLRK